MDNKVLIVEDEFVVANALRLTLEQAGYSICGIAASAVEADEILQQQKPELVLLDIQLEGRRSGIDLATDLKAKNIAFVYLSANSSQKVLEEAKKTEPYGFLVKPFREKDLLVALDIACYRHKNSLESKLRRAELLQKELAQMYNTTSETKERLLRIARILQPHIPFDLIFLAGSAPDTECAYPYGYLRIGFDEYQCIGENESMAITGQKRNAFFLTGEDHYSEKDAAIYNIGSANNKGRITTLNKSLHDYFRITSYLVFPVAVSTGSLVHYFFCSRHLAYAQNHIALLAQVKASLSNITPSISLAITPAAAAILEQPAYRTHSKAMDYPEFKNIIGKHPKLLAVLDLVRQVAPYSTSVLILGESGTGKEKVAESIHRFSTRREAPLIKINCAAIPASLIESELFGYEKGAFTGATEKRKGKFEQADGGTIFLDEIGELPLDMQARLLRVLQEKEIDPVGGSMPRKVDVRIVVATNRNLEKEIAEGRFRLDLYYRLNVFPITLPALRERKSDIGSLALYFADKFCKEFNKEFTGIGAQMAKEMSAYNWPGNIRELENVLERSVILNDGKSELALQQPLSGQSGEFSYKVGVETFDDIRSVQRETEREYIVSFLKKTKGRIRGLDGAAALLNIKPTTLESKMAKLGISKEDFKS